MPSLQSQLFNRFVGQRVKRLFSDFELGRARRELALQDWWIPKPSKNVEIEEISLTHCEANWIRPRTRTDRYVVYLPGGAWVLRTPNLHRQLAAKLADSANANVLMVFYRLAPEYPFPNGLEDCIEGYCHLLAAGISASQIVMGGDSAGGNLSLVMSAWARDENLRAPDAVIALSPLTDSRYSGPSIRGNLATDTMLGPLFGMLVKIPRLILSWMFVLENRIRQGNPLVSPVYGDLSRLPPTLLQVSESEMLRDDAYRYVNKARKAGSPVYLQSWGGLLHVWQIFYPDVPEAGEAWQRIDEFLKRVEADTA